MRNTVSFLVGSGFSIPAGIKGVKELNARLSKINEEEILIGTDQLAMFLNGQIDNNRWSNADERLFVQEFLKFYNSKVIPQGDQFHYETFYDYYYGYLIGKEHKKDIEEFYKVFGQQHLNYEDNRDCHNRISDFNRTFSQLLSSILHDVKYFQDISTLNWPPYDSFIRFLGELAKDSDVKIHSLNHDLLLDWLGNHHSSTSMSFCDGYTLAGSPYFGLVSFDFNPRTPFHVHKEYYVKLEYYAGKYDKAICLYKLHGSIVAKKVYPLQTGNEAARIKNDYGVNGYFMEWFDMKKGDYQLERLGDDIPPDFLSGTTNKMRFYKGDSYYQNLFKCFEENLKQSQILFVIGYGFQDPGINDYLVNYCLDQQKRMIVIDPRRPKTDLIDRFSATHIPKSVADVSYAEWLQFYGT
jgi:hypothetical protein